MATAEYHNAKANFNKLKSDEQSSFVIETALNMLGIYDQPGAPDRTTVEAAIPIAIQAIALASNNKAVFLQFAQYWNQIAPAATIVAAAIKAQQTT